MVVHISMTRMRKSILVVKESECNVIFIVFYNPQTLVGQIAYIYNFLILRMLWCQEYCLLTLGTQKNAHRICVGMHAVNFLFLTNILKFLIK